MKITPGIIQLLLTGFISFFINKLKQNEKSLPRLLCTMIFAGAALALEKTISGKVTSAADDSPLPFVVVAVKGSTKGVNSDMNGN